MADKKTKVAKPAPKPPIESEPVPKPPIESEPKPAPELRRSSESENSDDVMSAIDSSMWKKGFYLRVRKHQAAARGMLFAWQVERITSNELETQDLSDLLHDKFGPGVYRLHLYTLDGKKMFENRKFETAVGDITEQRPARTGQPLGNPPDFRRGPIPPAKNSQERVAERPDVQDAKAKVEMAKAELDLLEVEEKKRSIKGGDQNQSIERIVTSLGQSMKDSITLLTQTMAKPAGDSPQIAALNEKIRELEKKTETNLILNFMAESNKQNIQLMQDSNKTLAETLRQNKSKGGVDDLKETLEVLGLARKWKKEDREDEWEERDRFMPMDRPPVEQPFWKGVVTGIMDFVKDLNKDGQLTAKLAAMKDPPVQPQIGKIYTPEEVDAVIKREVDEAVENYKKSLPLPEPNGAVKTEVPPSIVPATQPIPDGETTEEFVAKKKVMNALLALLAEEMILCPRDCEWMRFALGKLPDDILIAIRDAADGPGLFAVFSKYADAEVVTALKAKLESDTTVDKKKSVWFLNGFNILKAAITEELKPAAPVAPVGPAATQVTINTGATGIGPLPAVAGTTSSGFPPGTVTQ